MNAPAWLRVAPRTLLALAALVWLAAGINIARIGLSAYANEALGLVGPALSVVVGFVFWFMVFNRLTIRHTARIRTYTDRMLFVHFFDRKSFVIMAVMMTAGVTIRSLSLAPNAFIAVFYTGLGCALTLAGAKFAMHFATWRAVATA